jgi:hypothetical protein
MGTTISWLHDDAIGGVAKARATIRLGSTGLKVLIISRPALEVEPIISNRRLRAFGRPRSL